MPEIQQFSLGLSRIVRIEFRVGNHQDSKGKKGLYDLKEAIIRCLFKIRRQKEPKQLCKRAIKGPAILDRVVDVIDTQTRDIISRLTPAAP